MPAQRDADPRDLETLYDKFLRQSERWVRDDPIVAAGSVRLEQEVTNLAIAVVIGVAGVDSLDVLFEDFRRVPGAACRLNATPIRATSRTIMTKSCASGNGGFVMTQS